MPCQGKGSSLETTRGAGRAVVPKERYSWCWLVCWVKFVSHDKNNKDGEHFGYRLTFHNKQMFCLIMIQWSCGRTRIINLFWLKVEIEPSGLVSLTLVPLQPWSVTQDPVCSILPTFTHTLWLILVIHKVLIQLVSRNYQSCYSTKLTPGHLVTESSHTLVKL